MGQPPYPPGQDPYGYGGDPYGQQQPYYPQQGAQYPAPQQYPMVAVAPTNGTATAALILGICGIFSCGLTSIPAIFFGHIAQGQIKRTGEGGSGMAVAGLVLGYLLTIGWLVYWVLFVWIWGIAIWSTSQGGSYSGTY